jgi:hypothetical protein
MTLFTPQHIASQKQVHEECPAYGSASLVFAPMVSELINANEVRTLLDYGSGLGQVPANLELNHQVDVQLYDPAIDTFADQAKPAEMVICLDVLDVVEPDCVDAVLDHLRQLTLKMAFFSINTAAPEGAVHPSTGYQNVEWWLPKLMQRFELHYFSRIGNGFVVVLKALDRPAVN